MDKVETKDCERVAPLFRELVEYHLSVAAVCAGTAPGEVWVDALDDPSLSATEKLVLVGQLQAAEEEHGRVLDQVTQTSLAVALARDVEHASVVTRGSAAKVAARGRSSSLIVGAVIGLLVGVLMALAWDPVKARLARSRTAAAG